MTEAIDDLLTFGPLGPLGNLNQNTHTFTREKNIWKRRLDKSCKLFK